MKKIILTLTTFLLLITASNSFACGACNLSNANIGANLLLPNEGGAGIFFVEHNYLSQNENFNGSTQVDDYEANHHSKITSHSTVLGTQYMFNKNWGINVRVPYMQRRLLFAEHDEEEEEEEEEEHEHKNSRNPGLGDVRITGIYSGFSDDLSAGIIFGAKLPTGETTQDGVEFNAQLGTGSYDLILGFFHNTDLLAIDDLGWFSQATIQKPVITRDKFTPGEELVATTGFYYNLGRIGDFYITPNLQLTYFHKKRNSGPEADYENSGYKRALISFGPEIRYEDIRFYTDISLPLYQYANGNQLGVGHMVRGVVSFGF